ncbi:MAG: 3-hydroxyacyl-CoA dehydrogenase NAD-binding domain-containing protein [Rhodovarius sp.]|nr:3-hydroxyacyl-CoA dehydrogenase NAD-binding domain-containing protein [Rhodovarius sp.]
MQNEAPAVEHAFDGDVHVLRIANPPVNTLKTAVRAGLLDGIRRSLREGARAIILIGTGRMFSAGAEMTEFGKPRQPPSLPEVFDAIETSPAPVVAAIHGHALGGGLELALACHARLASPEAVVGLPEVKRGFVPGAGGTQRLPRLIGAEAALRIIVSGEPVKAEEALKLGIIDAIIEGDLEKGAIAWVRQALASGRSFTLARHRTDRIEGQDMAAFEQTAAALLKRARGQESPQGCVNAVRAALTLPFEEGLLVERQEFQRLVQGEQSQALRYIFFGEREVARVPGMPPDVKPLPVERAVVIGGGTMGGGIAMCFANAHIPVTIVEANEEALARGIARCEANWQRTVAGGKLSQAEYEKRRAFLKGTTDWDVVKDADIVIEAVFEDMSVKKEVFAKLDRLARPGIVLATNTSTLDIDQIASATGRPELVCGMHFFSPANVMRLLEIVRGAKTSHQTIATAMEVGRRIGKVNVVVGNCDGFVGNRMTGKRGFQLERLLLEGALPQDIDRVMEAYGMAMGPCATGDLAGLDIGAAVRRARGTVAPIADALVAAGRYGQKTGKGWYIYDEKRQRHPDPEVERIIVEMSEKMQVRRRKIEDQEILERLLLPMVNEGARILEEGIAARPVDIDVIFVNGFGWPAWRGGPMFWADRMGLRTVRDKLAHYYELTGDPNLKPAPLIEKLAAEGGSFASMGAKQAA